MTYSLTYMALKDRLREAMAGPPKMTQAALARAVGVKQPTVNDWLSGRTKTIRGPILVRVAAALRVSPDWLATGRGQRANYSASEGGVNYGDMEARRASQIEKLDDVILATAELWVRMEEGAGRKFQPVRRLQRKLEIAGMIQADGGGLRPEHSQQLLDAARKGEWDEPASGDTDAAG